MACVEPWHRGPLHFFLSHTHTHAGSSSSLILSWVHSNMAFTPPKLFSSRSSVTCLLLNTIVNSQFSPYLTCQDHCPGWSLPVPWGLHLTPGHSCSPSFSPASLDALFSFAGSSTSWALNIGMPYGIVCGPLSFSIYIPFLGGLIHSDGFQCCLSADKFQILSLQPDLGSSCLLSILFRCLIDISDLTF